jgi:hypothetical protein
VVSTVDRRTNEAILKEVGKQQTEIDLDYVHNDYPKFGDAVADL